MCIKYNKCLMETSYFNQITASSVSASYVDSTKARDPSPLCGKKPRAITAIVLGVILSLGGLFLLLAALQVLPHGLNAISQLGIGGKLVGGASIGLGVFSIGYGLIGWYRNKKPSANREIHENEVPESPEERVTQYIDPVEPGVSASNQAVNNNLMILDQTKQPSEGTSQTHSGFTQVSDSKKFDVEFLQRVEEHSQFIPITAGETNSCSTTLSTHENDGRITHLAKPLEGIKFDPSNLFPAFCLPSEITQLACSFVEPSTASALACVSKDWNFYVNQGYAEEIEHLINKIYRPWYPYREEVKKKYSNLTCLGITLEHKLYKTYALNNLYSLYHIEIMAMIKHWGTVRAVMADNDGINWCFIVDFHEPISLRSRQGEGVMVNMSGGHGIVDSPFSLRGIYEGDSSLRTMILSSNRMAVSISIVNPDTLWLYEHVIDDPRIKALDRQIQEQKLKNTCLEVSQLRLQKKYLLFSQEDCLSFTLQMVKNSGKKILTNGLYLSGSDLHREFSVKEI